MKKIAIAIFSVFILGIATVSPVKVEAGGPPIHPIIQFESDPIKQNGPPIHP